MATTYRPEYQPATGTIIEAFVEEIEALGGSVPDVYDDGQRLCARAVLQSSSDVRPGDTIRGGVAVRAMGPEIAVHPYTYRKVCSNGAIVAHALETRRLERVESSDVFAPSYEVSVTLTDFRFAVKACASPEAFIRVRDEMRSATEMEADVALHFLPYVSTLPTQMVSSVVPLIFQRFAADRDMTLFGLMNAVTAVARDIRDPETKWRLEELGGSMPARVVGLPKTVSPAVAAAG
jgi:hypothetical protein